MSESGGDDARPSKSDPPPYSPPASDFVPDVPWWDTTATASNPAIPAPRFEVDPDQTGPITPIPAPPSRPPAAPSPAPASPPPAGPPAPPSYASPAPPSYASPPVTEPRVPPPPLPPGFARGQSSAPSSAPSSPTPPVAAAPGPPSGVPWAPAPRGPQDPPAYRPPAPYRPFERAGQQPGRATDRPADRPWAPSAGEPQSAGPPAAPVAPPAAPVAPPAGSVAPPAAPQPIPLGDDELDDTLNIDAVVDGHEIAANDIPPAASPLPRPPSLARHRRDEPDLTRLEAASSGGALPPLPAAPGGAEAGTPGDKPAVTTRSRRAEKRDVKRRRKSPWWELPVLVIVAILIAVLVKTFVVQPFYIPSASMEKTLHGSPDMGNDRILVNKPIYDLRDPHGGDIVVFHAPPGWDDEPASKPPGNPIVRTIRGFGQLVGFVPPDGLVLVKRVIATGGQGVKGDAQGNVYVSKNGLNGPWDKLNEPYVYESGTDTHAEFGPVVVPKGRLWVMGDHRNDSADSRFHCGLGGSQGSDGPACDPTASTVPANDVIGKAVVVAWPPSHWRTLGTPKTFKHLAEGMPLMSGFALVTPVLFIRRRRRKRRWARTDDATGA